MEKNLYKVTNSQNNIEYVVAKNFNSVPELYYATYTYSIKSIELIAEDIIVDNN